MMPHIGERRNAMPPPDRLSEAAVNLAHAFAKRLKQLKKIDGKKKRRLLSGIVAGIFLIAIFYNLLGPNAYAVVINGREVAVVESKQEIERTLEDILAEKGSEYSQEIKIANSIEYKKVRVKSGELTEPQLLKLILESNITLQAAATTIIVNGEPLVTVAGENSAHTVLEELKKSYLPVEETARIYEVKFREDITFSSNQMDLREVLTPEEALAKLKGTEIIDSEYEVQKGDSLWLIARKYNLLVDDIRAANPDIKGERLDIGQKLKLTREEPLVNVIVVYEQELTEKIPFQVRYENNSNLMRGQERIKTAGSSGEQRVVCRFVTENGLKTEETVLEREVLKEPVTQVVERGTRLIMASRSGGSGQLAWPLRGSITSRYGSRGGEFHHGIDIAGSRGDPVTAAESGTVITASYVGTYGNLVIIDHGDNIDTRYAHLSGFAVKVGDKVERGQVVGYVGTTGRSTGPHLHFEVRIGGSSQNPLNYLN